MFFSELKKTLRHFWRNRTYSAINLIGLGLGLAFALLALLYISEELSFDRFHKDADEIVIVEHWEYPPDRAPFGGINTPLGLGPTLREDFPEVEAAASVLWWNAMLRFDDESSNELLYFADPEFFDIFTFEALKGNPAQAIQNRSEVVLTESAADRFFGTVDVIGEPLQVQIGDDFVPMTVGAVLKDPPNTSTLSFEILVTADRLHDFMPDRAFDAWMWVHPYTFARLADGVTLDEFNKALVRVGEKHNFAERYGEDVIRYHANRWVDFHLHSTSSDGLLQPSRPEYLWGIGIVGLLILIVAAVNYTTISVAASSKRVGEVGVRMVLGAGRRALRLQLLLESVLMTLISLPIALLIVELVLPSFANVVGREVKFAMSPTLLLSLLLVVALLGLAAGFYPTMLMSRLNPVNVLKGQSSPKGNRWLLNSLVVVQFSVAVALVSGSFMIQRQISYMIDEQLESKGEQILSVYIPPVSIEQSDLLAERLKQAMKQIPGVTHVSGSSNSLGWPWAAFGYQDEQNNYLTFNGNHVDSEYIPAHDLTLVAGRNFDPNNSADKVSSVIVNEALVKAYGYTDPIGQTLPGSYSGFTIIGVVKDFHFESLHSAIEPLVLFENSQGFLDACMDVTNFGRSFNYLQVRLSPENISGTLNQVERTYEEVSDGQPYQSVFLDDVVQGIYTADLSVRNVMVRASGLTVFIALLGVLGLASMRVSQRRRELTIRKVLGASLVDIQRLMASEFAVLVAIGSLIALPVTWWGLKMWLDGFAYHINVSVGAIALISIGVVLVALLVVATQSFRASLVNPAEILRDE